MELFYALKECNNNVLLQWRRKLMPIQTVFNQCEEICPPHWEGGNIEGASAPYPRHGQLKAPHLGIVLTQISVCSLYNQTASTPAAALGRNPEMHCQSPMPVFLMTETPVCCLSSEPT